MTAREALARVVVGASATAVVALSCANPAPPPTPVIRQIEWACALSDGDVLYVGQVSADSAGRYAKARGCRPLPLRSWRSNP